jgi:hypothetical protein
MGTPLTTEAFLLVLGGSDILCREAVGSISLALLGRLLQERVTWPLR